MMLLPAQYSKTGGFTLLEFLVAVLIMMVGLLALLQSVNIAIEMNGSNKKRTDAINIADRMMMEEKAFINGRTFSQISSAPISTTKKSYAGLGFVNYSIVETPKTLSSATKRIMITVSWREKGVRKEHSLTTLISVPPPI
jgi:type IV pilus assembly protein PilV